MAHSRSILVTGGAGFIGSHACKALNRAGFLPVSFDNLSTGHADAVRWGPLIVGDVRDPRALERAFVSYTIEAVIHFAASAYVGESVVNPASYYDNNVGGMIGLLAACRTAAVSRVVFSSSCATYGIPDQLPITEATPQRPINPYGRTKLICEEMLRDHDAAYGLRHVALRYFNAAGADPEGDLRERHEPETHLVPLALRAATDRHPALGILGTDYDTADGTCIRDYVHVTDLARAHVLALDYLLGGGESIALNLGTGQGTSVREVVQTVERVTGRRPSTLEGDRRPGDPPALVADPSLAETVLGFRPERSDIGTIVRDAAPTFGLGQIDAAAA
jgi:UDP-arabinose 4-epimerase